jgi:GntR family transcriptional regulator
MPTLKRDHPIPLYHQLKTAILREIERGRWKPDDRLPTEDDLIARFQVSRITVRQALRELTTLGYIRREQGRGTFVQRPPLEEGPRELRSFTAEMTRHGYVATSRVLEQGVIGAPPDVAESLGIASGDKVFRLHRLRLADGEPMGVQTAHVPIALAPGIEAISFVDRSLYEELSERYGLHPDSARETHHAVLLTAELARLLAAAEGSPALAAERLTKLDDGRAFECVQSIMRGDRYKIVLDLSSLRPHPLREVR